MSAVDLSRRGALMVSFHYRARMRLGRVDEARAIVDEVRERSPTEYIADSFWLGPALLDGDEDAVEAALRLGPLVRQLSLYSQR